MKSCLNLEQGLKILNNSLNLESVNFSILAPHEKILDSTKQAYIFGCKLLGKKVFNGCAAAGIEILGFIDNNSLMQGKQYCGKTVYALDEINPSTSVSIIIASTTHEQEIRQQLILNEFSRVVGYPILSVFNEVDFPPEMVYREMQVDLVKNAKHYLQLNHNLVDQESIRTLDGIIKYRLSLDPKYLEEIRQKEEQRREYFDASIVKLRGEDVFVDGGGYDGDTALEFSSFVAGQYKKIYFFEPDRELLLKAKNKLTGLHDIIFLEAAIYSRSKTLKFKMTGGLDGLIDSEGDREVEALALDECVREKITFLKLDVEGSESEALMGGRQHLESDAPILAISGYHNPSDIWQLPELIKSLNPKYQIYLRHYSNTTYETIIYAIPREK
jgi:FkbM family methyltransferase